MANGHAEQGGQAHLDDGAGQGDALDGKQVVNREMQADAEHQQHDADFGKLRSRAQVGDKARGGRADQDAGNKIADQGGGFQALGDETEDQGKAESGRDGGDQGNIVGHSVLWGLLNIKVWPTWSPLWRE